MEFRIADTFSDSLARLTGEEQKAVKTTAFDLQMNPANPGMQFHRLNKAKDPNFSSVRASRDIRVIVHKTGRSLMLCFVGHHDDAYAWAERRKIERHPKTGAAQLVEVRETIREIQIPQMVEIEEPEVPKPLLFADVAEEKLLAYGVPPEWIDDIRGANEDSLLELAEHLPGEAAEALLDLATGVEPQVQPVLASDTDAFEHPEAQRRFRVVTDVEELERALDYPWDKWTVFLHPSQRELVERDYPGPARVAGSAGTGKTIVALHRAVHLARSDRDSRVLLTTFSGTLANALRNRLKRLIGNEPRIMERIEVHSMSDIGHRLYQASFGALKLASAEQVRALLVEAAGVVENQRFSRQFLYSEWESVVDAWQLRTWEEYRDVQRLGRKTRLAETQRKTLWSIFERVRAALTEQGLLTEPEMFTLLARRIGESGRYPFSYAVIDEAQDIGVSELRFLAALGGDRPNGLFFAGDLGQRIFRTPFSWKALGVDVRGKSSTLRINYRTSHQIRRQADRLLPPELADVDGNAENRRGAQSVFNGPAPLIELFDSEDAEIESVSAWIRARLEEGIQPHEIAVFVRSDAQHPRAEKVLEQADEPFVVLSDKMETKLGSLSVATMHQAKGLEFRAVAVIACDDEVVPLQERIETVVEDSDLEEVYQTERHLLYVACTRAREHLLVTGVRPASEFLEDLGQKG